MEKMVISTQESKQVIDITDKVNEILSKESPDKNSLCNIFSLHTTTAVSVADLDPGTDLDMLEAFYDMVPAHKTRKRNGEGVINYNHPHDPGHTPDHILSTAVGPSITIPVSGGKLVLGTWQRVVLFEFDGPRERSLVVSVL